MTEEHALAAFTKMHGAGNDYVYFDWRSELPSDLEEFARRISNIHYGIGSDGIVIILHSDVADFRMRMFNSDGSEAQMCGNATRCIAKYLFDRGLTQKTKISLETKAGIKNLWILNHNGRADEVKVDMGEPILDILKIPASDKLFSNNNSIFSVGNRTFRIKAIGMGNPHGVIFTDEISDELVLNIGPILEKCDLWPEKANIEFVRVKDRTHIDMRVWERGTGETLACGTGACASVVAGILDGYLDKSVHVNLLGGELFIQWDEQDNHIYMTGNAVEIARGYINITYLMRND